ncbi:unnamed protein product [Owenia fusiformis]|uniref:G-protein coupled receptors family 1 profile domain-containing protein n=1 Tax=Owenia fusiformis TaxID=6347 RepID=A0A8S4N071_OWEFU|nr:unnamed protein product [Owenia fusiformis]
MSNVCGYIAICHPFKAKTLCTIRNSYKAIFAVWICAGVISVPTAFVITEVEYFGGLPQCDLYVSSDIYARLFSLHLLLVVLCIPLVIMSAMYALTTQTLWWSISNAHKLKEAGEAGQGNGRVQTNYKQQEDINGRIQVIKMLIMVVAIFIICWAPVRVIAVCDVFGKIALSQDVKKHLNTAMAALAYSNSCLNPIIYCFMLKQFRRGFLHIISCGKHIDGPYTDRDRSSFSLKSANTGTESIADSSHM